MPDLSVILPFLIGLAIVLVALLVRRSPSARRVALDRSYRGPDAHPFDG